MSYLTQYSDEKYTLKTDVFLPIFSVGALVVNSEDIWQFYDHVNDKDMWDYKFYQIKD